MSKDQFDVICVHFIKFSNQIALLILFASITSSISASELLLKSGEAFLIEEINESADVVNVRWKGRQYRIPKSEIQRIDYQKKGPESSYHYSEFRLTDGSSIRGIIVERKKDRLIFKTDLGFIEIEKSKIQNLNSSSLENETVELNLFQQCFYMSLRDILRGQVSKIGFLIPTLFLYSSFPWAKGNLNVYKLQTNSAT